VWRGFPKDYESVPFPVTAPPTGIAGFKEINVVNRICPATLRFFQLSRVCLEFKKNLFLYKKSIFK
jgi:hypothetical protein